MTLIFVGWCSPFFLSEILVFLVCFDTLTFIAERITSNSKAGIINKFPDLCGCDAFRMAAEKAEKEEAEKAGKYGIKR